MNLEIIKSLLNGVATLLPLIPGGGAIGPIVTIVGQVVPFAIQEAMDLTPIIKNIIAAVRADPTATADQLAALDEQEALLDAAFEAAAAKAEAEDANP